jgi:hypothetical protein
MRDRYFIIVSLLAISCSSSRIIHLEGEGMSADLVPLSGAREVVPDSTFATTFDTIWVSGKPITIHRAQPYATTTNFDIHLAKDDSVSICYLDRGGGAIGKPLIVFLPKGSYSYKLDQFGFPSGVYLNICIIGETKWSKTILVLR